MIMSKNLLLSHEGIMTNDFVDSLAYFADHTYSTNSEGTDYVITPADGFDEGKAKKIPQFIDLVLDFYELDTGENDESVAEIIINEDTLIEIGRKARRFYWLRSMPFE